MAVAETEDWAALSAGERRLSPRQAEVFGAHLEMTGVGEAGSVELRRHREKHGGPLAERIEAIGSEDHSRLTGTIQKVTIEVK